MAIHKGEHGSIGSSTAASWGMGLSPEEADKLHRAAVESGFVDFHGRDSFQSIKHHMDSVMASKPEPSSRPTSASKPAAAAVGVTKTQPGTASTKPADTKSQPKK